MDDDRPAVTSPSDDSPAAAAERSGPKRGSRGSRHRPAKRRPAKLASVALATTPTFAPASDDDATAGGSSPDAASAATTPPPRPPQRRRHAEPKPKRDFRMARLSESAGPDPATPLADVRLAVGTIVGVFGIEGEMKLRFSTDDPDRLTELKQVWVGAETKPRRVMGFRFHGGMGLLRLQFVASPEDARSFVGQPIRVAGTDVRPPEPGEYLLYQLMGLEVLDESGTGLGKVTDLIETGAHDVFVVTPCDNGPDILLPNHPEVVLEIDPTAGRMVVRPLNYGD